MKKIFLFLVASFVVISSFAQTNIPQLVSFSAVVRDANNVPLANTPVSIRLTFKQGGASGPLVYCALHQNTTNQNGFISIQLNRDVLGTGCNGAPSNAFQNIPWENGGFWMEVEYQTIPGSPFVNLGQLELASSFYAFAAGTAERIASITTAGAQNGDILVYNSTTGKFEPGQSGITSVQWANVQNKPNFATVATSGSYSDLTNQPTLFDGNYNSLTNKPITINSMSSNGDTLYLSNGQTFISSNNVSFSMLPPTATTQVANIQYVSATLNGTVNANGSLTIVVFEWGLTPAYGNVANVSQSPVIGLSNVAVNANLFDLQPNTTYHYRIKATNAVNVTYSNDMSFTTEGPIPPIINHVFTNDPITTWGYQAISVAGNQVWQYDSINYYMKMTGFADGSNNENIDWLITPSINLSTSIGSYFHFLHAAKFGAPASELSVWASIDYNGTNMATANWTQLTVPNFPSGADWTFVESGNVNLIQFAGQNNVRIGFKYTSTTSSATTWEIKEIKVY
jgi:hypothetical protein